jgi:hypothetical protein
MSLIYKITNIETLIGHRACLRDANKDKTDEEFARWWGMQQTMNSDDFMNYWYPELAELIAKEKELER